jgi:hypothetical protein
MLGPLLIIVEVMVGGRDASKKGVQRVQELLVIIVLNMVGVPVANTKGATRVH